MYRRKAGSSSTWGLTSELEAAAEVAALSALSSILGLECVNACHWDERGHTLLWASGHHYLMVDGRDLEMRGLPDGPLACVDPCGCRSCRRRLAAHMADDSVSCSQLSHSSQARELDHVDVHAQATSAGMVCWWVLLRLSCPRLLGRSNWMLVYRGSMMATRDAEAYSRMVM